MMAWRASTLEPRAVLDAYDEIVCVCRSARHAELIVRALNEECVIDAKPQPVRMSAAA